MVENRPGADVSEKDAKIFEFMNSLRADPHDYVPFLEDLRGRYEGYLIKQPNKVTIRTKEGVQAVDEAIDFLNQQKPVGPLKWNDCLATAAQQHTQDIGPKGLVQHESSDHTSVKERLK